MPYKSIPEWLLSFTFQIYDKFETGIFSPDEEGDKIDDLYFEDGGCVIGSIIHIRDKAFVVKDIQFNCNMFDNIDSLTTGARASMHVTLIVEEKAG